MRDGKSFLPEPLVLDARDSGTEEFPVVYAAYPGEQPVLSGGRQVGGWPPYQGKIVQCVIPAARGGKWKFRQLFYNGKCQIRARWPDFEPQNPYAGGWAKMEGPAEPKSEIAFRYQAGRLSAPLGQADRGRSELLLWRQLGQQLHLHQNDRRKETHHHPGPRHDLFQQAGGRPSLHLDPRLAHELQDDMMAFHSNQRYIVENLLEELDQPGEWCLDSQEGKLYFWPPDDAAAPSDVVAPLLDGLISLRGTSHVVLSGFTFTETNGGDNIVREGMDGVGTMYPVPGWKYCGEAVHLDAAQGCRIEDNRFARWAATRCVSTARACETWSAETTSPKSRLRRHDGGRPDHYPMFNEITDNCIRRAGVMNKYTPACCWG